MSGGPDRTRTCDLRFRKPLLYPLSYGTVCITAYWISRSQMG